MEGHLTYVINGVERKMFFGNYALEQTLDHFGSSVSDISVLLNTKLLPLIRVFIYHAAAYPILKEGNEPDFKLFDIHDWIDQTGGTNGEFMLKASEALFKSVGLRDEEQKETAQKKSKVKK